MVSSIVIRDMDKGLVEMAAGGQWLPGNGYFVFYKRSESESITSVPIVFAYLCICTP